MSRDFFDPSPEEQNVVLVNAENLREAEKTYRILRALQSGRR